MIIYAMILAHRIRFIFLQVLVLRVIINVRLALLRKFIKMERIVLLVQLEGCYHLGNALVLATQFLMMGTQAHAALAAQLLLAL